VVQNQILAKEQYGFRSKLSTDKASYTLIHEILTALNNKQIVGGIFCDLRNAFDCVNIRISLTKLLVEKYGIVEKFKALIKSYLTERYQRVVIHNNTKNSYSDWEIVKHGVPQGSILGPLFFLLFINDLLSVTSKNATLVLYADDTSLISTGSNHVKFSTKVNTVFADINEWFRSNLMSLHFDKTHFLQFRTKNSKKFDLNITLLNKHITNTINHGSVIVNHVLTQLSSACYAIRTVTPLMAEETLRTIYFSYIHSILSYGIILWGK
jgi:hypothetical protein